MKPRTALRCKQSFSGPLLPGQTAVADSAHNDRLCGAVGYGYGTDAVQQGSGLMDFGIAMATAADSWKLTQRAEALGFDYAWFYDTQMLSAECFVAMGAAAVKT
jgi:hypothetical protein